MKAKIVSDLNKAFHVLRRNYGCPGNDGVSIKLVKKEYDRYINFLADKLNRHTYSFERNPKSLTIKDFSLRERVIFVYNVLERWVQHYIKININTLIDSTLTEYVYAYRRGKTDTESYSYILRNKPKYIIMLDIQNFFGSIDKNRLYKKIEKIGVDRNFNELIRSSLEHNKKGIPAGHVLSCTLSNLYLNEFDYEFPNNYTRYSDDMMFALDSEKEITKKIESINKILNDYGLSLNKNKTRIVEKPTLNKLKK